MLEKIVYAISCYDTAFPNFSMQFANWDTNKTLKIRSKNFKVRIITNEIKKSFKVHLYQAVASLKIKILAALSLFTHLTFWLIKSIIRYFIFFIAQ